jgi:hypothetical protein
MMKTAGHWSEVINRRAGFKREDGVLKLRSEACSTVRSG